MNINRLGCLTLLIFIFTFSVNAQQMSGVSNYLNSGIYLNPSVAGSDEKVSMMAMIRNELNQFAGNPSLQIISIHGTVLHKSAGIGLLISNDKSGMLKNTGVTGCYTYRIRLGKGFFSSGISGGIRQLSFSSSLHPEDLEDPYLPVSSTSLYYPDLNIGFLYKSTKTTLSASSLHLINPSDMVQSIKLLPHYFFYAAYSINPENYFVLQPASLIKIVSKAVIQADFSIYVKSPEASVGLSYRTNQSVALQLMLQLNNLIAGLTPDLSFGYAYDYSFHPYLTGSSGNNEIFLRYRFEILKSTKKILREPKNISPKFY